MNNDDVLRVAGEPVAYLFGNTDFESEALLPDAVEPDTFNEHPEFYEPLYTKAQVLAAANERIRELEQALSRRRLESSAMAEDLCAAKEQLLDEREVSDKLEKALKFISKIKHRTTGCDWDEIIEAQTKADSALAEVAAIRAGTAPKPAETQTCFSAGDMADAAAKAAQVEREACAKVCEVMANTGGVGGWSMASAIRMRGKEPE